MGESKNLFNIPAYLKLGNKRLKVLKWGAPGLIVEKSPLLEGKEEVVADFIFPYDAYNELVIPDIKLLCQPKDESFFCRFGELPDEQQDILKFIIREYLWKRIISIPSEFMNYTQDNEIRKELLAFQRDITLRKKLKKILYAVALIIVLGGVFLGAKWFKSGNNRVLTVKYSELRQNEENLRKVAMGSSVEKRGNSSNEKGSENPQSTSSGTVEEKPVKKEGKASSVPVAEVTAVELQNSTKKEIPGKVTQKTGKSSLSRDEDYYCVQVATDTSAERLVKLTEKLKGLPYVRVEKIGKYYTLRVGFDRTYQEDEELAHEIRKRLRKRVFPRVCAYRPERWVYPQAEAK